MAQDSALLDDYELEEGTDSDHEEERFKAHVVRLQAPLDETMTALSDVCAVAFDNERMLNPSMTLPDLTPVKPVSMKPLLTCSPMPMGSLQPPSPMADPDVLDPEFVALGHQYCDIMKQGLHPCLTCVPKYNFNVFQSHLMGSVSVLRGEKQTDWAR